MISPMAHESQKSKVVERKLKRRQVVAESYPVPANISYLEARSVKAPTIRDYSRRFSEFQSWMNLRQLAPQVPYGPSHSTYPSDGSGSEGVASRSASPTANASAYTSGGGNHRGLSASKTGRVKSSIVHPVHELHEARRMQCTDGPAVDSPDPAPESSIQLLGSVTPPSRRSDPRQDRGVRQFGPDRFRPVDQPISDETGKSKRRNSTSFEINLFKHPISSNFKVSA